MTLLYAVHQLQLSHLCSFKTKLCMSAHCAFGELQLIRKLNYVLVNSFFLTLINKSVLMNNVEYFTQCALPSLQFPDNFACNSPMCFWCFWCYYVFGRFLNLLLVNLIETYLKTKIFQPLHSGLVIKYGPSLQFSDKIACNSPMCFRCGRHSTTNTTVLNNF